MNEERHTCPCCGYRTLETRYDWEICPVCFWEDDVVETPNSNPYSSCNRMRLSVAQQNFLSFGACERTMIPNVRKPKPDEPKDPNWTTI